jgi:peroxiredoxin
MSQQQRALDVGDRAPEFRLRHTFEADVDLAATLERGPALLVFYVFDFGGY